MTVTTLEMRCCAKTETPTSLHKGNQHCVSFKLNDHATTSQFTMEAKSRKEFDSFIVGADYSVVIQRIAPAT